MYESLEDESVSSHRCGPAILEARSLKNGSHGAKIKAPAWLGPPGGHRGQSFFPPLCSF